MALLLLCVLPSGAQTVGVGIDAPNAVLDVTADSSGILIPRIPLASTLDVAVVPTPIESELIYNTATAGAGATSVTPGFYYWDGSQWVRFSTEYDHDWYEEGGTNSPDNINDTIYTYGFVGIGINAPTAPLHVEAGGIGNPDSNSILAYNSNNLAGNRDAIIAARVVPGEGDPFFSVDVAGESGWSVGMDNSHNNRLKIANDWSDLSGSGGAATKMTIKTTGEVGIGTDDPSQLLHLNFTGRNGLLITGNGADDAFIEIINSGGSHYVFDDDSDGNNFVVESASDLNFNTGGATERATILGANGYVGIGVSIPSNRLDVQGYIEVGDQTSGGADVESAMRYNTTLKCTQVYDGWRWKCIGVPDVEDIVIYDGYDHLLNTRTWTGSYGTIKSFSISAVYPGQKLIVQLQMLIGDTWRGNAAFAHAYKIYGTGVWHEINDVPPSNASAAYWFTDRFELTVPAGHTAGNNLSLNFEYQGNYALVRTTVEKY